MRTLHLNKDIDSIIGQWCINAKNMFSYPLLVELELLFMLLIILYLYY